RRFEPHIFAKLLRVIGQLRAAQQRAERPAHALAWAGHDLVGDLFLLRRHGFRRERLEALRIHLGSSVMRSTAYPVSGEESRGSKLMLGASAMTTSAQAAIGRNASAPAPVRSQTSPLRIGTITAHA